ncbi:hypothetical protein PR001_g21073 [Phytophthora rubi]|uniref:CCHC-type domain-containing protein n=1 Tax=Phytophthora rubi TaxID=129364 RepID=A0A6A3JCP3_9STRA|nr:hypothetical protein PR001_g21073 [Phytophthora rubi]KAE9014853.1 hypothetical protein PR002_g14106 [Phytophthora rubi]
MDQWLREMESLRRPLLHYGKQITDEDYAETLLGHVSRTHRDVVRQFSKHYVVRDDGAIRPVPTAAQVMNALRAESALDERVTYETDAKPAHVCSCGKQAKDDSAKQKPSGNPSKGKQNKGKGRYKAKPKNEEEKQSGKKKETRSCYECGEVGHLRANCPSRKSNKSDRPVISEFKRWENKSGGSNAKRTDKNSSGICCRVLGASVVAATSVKTPAGTEMEWVLDSASDVHVCNNRSVLHNIRKDQVHFFLGYDGNTREDEDVGDVTLRVKNNKSPHAELMLPFTDVLLSPQTPDNLLSQDILEKDGWTVKYGFIDSQRVCWLRKDHVELLLPNTNRRYRLKVTSAAVYTLQSESLQ